MNQYVAQMNALTGTSLWHIPHRQDIVLSLAGLGFLCLVIAAAVLLRPEGELIPLRVRIRLFEDR